MTAGREFVPDRFDGGGVPCLLQQRNVLIGGGARCVDFPLVEEDAEQFVVTGKMLRSALNDGTKVLDGLLGQTVLGEDFRFGKVLGDEVEVLTALFRLGHRLHTGRRCGRRGAGEVGAHVELDWPG